MRGHRRGARRGRRRRRRAELAAEIQRAATMEAKGNSGVILSTIVRGMAGVLGERDGSRRRGASPQALRAGATSAYQAVKLPVEGTMLTVIREMAEEAERPDVRALPLEEALARVDRARGRRRRSGRPRCSTSCARRASSTRAASGSSSSLRGVLHGLTGEPLPDAARRDRGADRGVDPPRGVARSGSAPVFVVEGERARPRRALRGARAARRLAARDGRRVDREGPRPHRRARARARASAAPSASSTTTHVEIGGHAQPGGGARAVARAAPRRGAGAAGRGRARRGRAGRRATARSCGARAPRS